ncbi:MAG: flagella basal body P-ring formation protein FlgA [Candidatus Riflebacteria bacterium]|nr:flagella basal body P-ring formation protein FlgA [Candidatus Riflebacteria bacterium]
MTNSPLLTRCAAMIFGGALLLPISSAFALVESGKVAIKPAVLVDQARIDVSQIISTQVSPSMRETLTKIPLGTINQPLGEMTVDGAELAKRLGSLASLFDLPQRVQIRRRGDLLSGSEVATRIEEVVKERAPAGSQGQIHIDSSRLPRNVVLPGALISWKVSPMSENPLGMVLFSFEAECEGGKAHQIMQVEVWREIAAARVKRLIKKGAAITPGDITKEVVRIRTASAQVPASFDEVVGRASSMYKSPGSLLRVVDLTDIGAIPTHDRELDAAAFVSRERQPTMHAVRRTKKISESADADMDTNGVIAANEPAPANIGAVIPGETEDLPVRMNSGKTAADTNWLVKPGEHVDFMVKSGGLNLTVPARALDGGAAGTPIRLVNLQNQRSIRGRVVAKGQVEFDEH